MVPVQYHAGRFPPDEHLDWRALIPLLGPAAAAVARYDGTLAAVPDPDVLLGPLTTREAVLSSRIEGTEATMGDVLGFEAGQEPESPTRREDIHEVLNYRSALRRAEELTNLARDCSAVPQGPDRRRHSACGPCTPGAPDRYPRVPGACECCRGQGGALTLTHCTRHALTIVFGGKVIVKGF